MIQLAGKVRGPAYTIQKAELALRESGWVDFGWRLSAAADCICWTVSAGLHRPAAGGICWAVFAEKAAAESSLPRPKADTASTK